MAYIFGPFENPLSPIRPNQHSAAAPCPWSTLEHAEAMKVELVFYISNF
jgi:hypothetical protein